MKDKLNVVGGRKNGKLFVSGMTLGANFTFSDSRDVTIEDRGPTLFIQTDKPIYKPGQKGWSVEDVEYFNKAFQGEPPHFSTHKSPIWLKTNGSIVFSLQYYCPCRFFGKNTNACSMCFSFAPCNFFFSLKE